MPSPGTDEPNALPGLPLDLLRRAVEIYLGIAYPASDPARRPPSSRLDSGSGSG